MKTYFREVQDRNLPNQKWSQPILVFAIGMYCKIGRKAYEQLGNSFFLPCRSTIESFISKIPAKPGIHIDSIAAFLQRQPIGDIYHHQGLKMLKSGAGYKLVGMVTHGTWDAEIPERIHLHFREPQHMENPPALIPSPQQPNTSPQTPVPQWCDLATARATLAAEEIKISTMALHFMMSSISSNLVQGIGYLEIAGMTARVLKAVLFLAIQKINQLALEISNPEDSSQNLVHCDLGRSDTTDS